MKTILYLIALLLSASCLVMAIVAVSTSRSNAKLQGDLQQTSASIQNEAQTVSGTERISRSVLTDLGNIAISNTEVRVLLAKHGYTLTPNSPATGTAANVAAPGLLGTIQSVPTMPKIESATLPASAPVIAPKSMTVTPPASTPSAAPALTIPPGNTMLAPPLSTPSPAPVLTIPPASAAAVPAPQIVTPPVAAPSEPAIKPAKQEAKP